ncbi:MAG: NAD(+)/NADH kinase [Candidatus Heimdallarchaeota archaeon]|nr:NAD(+)/NADH kinase [Candidatus Heimdallarchaeota archaeon]MCK4254236.1 NAD(+)/NADH kinase [Candidatus Heimdallarchaeota archaeon]
MVSKDSCILITSSSQERVKKIAVSAYNRLKERGFNVFPDSFLAERMVDVEPVCSELTVELILVYGGDGTILKTFKTWKNIPILGVNCGRVGFLSEIKPEELDEALDKIERNDFFTEYYSALAVSADAFSTISAANDVVVTSDKIGQIISLKVQVNDKYLYSVNGDGLVVSTCVGSSAYSLSAGGALIMPNVDAFSLVPICPFSRRIVPLVISSDVKLTITNLSEYRAGHVVVDGATYYSLGHGESITVQKSTDKIGFLRFSDSYVERVRNKLLKYDPDDFNE